MFEVRGSSSGRTRCSSGSWSASSPAAICSSKACPAWPRRSPGRPSPVLGGTFERIQFTPDLMPSDLVGTRIYRRTVALRRRARPGLRQLRARRRDQPGARQGAIRAPRGDGRAPGDDRPRHLRGVVAVLGPRHQTRRSGGHVSVARGAARPVHDEDPARRAEPVGRGADRRSLAGRGRTRPARSGSTRPAWSASGSPSPRSTSTRGSSATRSAWSRRPGELTYWGAPDLETNVVRRQRARFNRTSSTPPGRWRSCTAADTSCRRTSSPSPRTSSATGSC